MSFIADMLVGRQIVAVLSDSEVTYLMMADGTQVTVRGLVVVEPPTKLVQDGTVTRTHGTPGIAGIDQADGLIR